MIRVSPQEVRGLASEVNRGAGELNEKVGTLTAAFNNSSSYWEGNAREQFSQAFRDWNGSWAQMHKSLEEMQKLITQYAKNVEDLENSIRRG